MTNIVEKPIRLYAVIHKPSGSICLHVAPSRKEAIEKWCDLMDGCRGLPGYKDAWKIWKKAGYTTAEIEMRVIGQDTFTSGRKIGEWPIKK